MKKHNCEKWLEEGNGCTICNSILKGMTVAEIKEIQSFINWIITAQKREIAKLRDEIAYLKGEKDV